jgi:alkanesulfonate monooxygenase SsuD/methylene tetrahydromethanopterin reductase-like flavin-dependent oxidoreductase (luciferase family)
MDIGLLSLGDLITDPVTGDRRTPAQRHRNLVDQAVLAETIGMSRIHLGEHHLCDYVLSSPAVVLGAIAERTTTLRLSNGVALGVNNDPVRLAEDYATVDVLSDGRAEPCLGRGTFFPHVFTAFGQDPRSAKEVFAEHVELFVRLLSECDVEWRGTHHAPMQGWTMQPRPIQQPRPPVWLGAGASADSIVLAATHGLWLMLPTVFGTIEMFRPAVELYQATWAELGRDPATARIGCCSHLWVAPTSQGARRQWEPRYRAYIDWVNALQGWSAGKPSGTLGGLGGFDFEALVSSTAICGSPAEVIERMASIRDALSLDTHIVMLDMGGVPDAELFAAIECFGSEVLPAIGASAARTQIPA